MLDLSRILAAPLAAQLLGDLGAEVIKVERPGSGDDSRSYGPPFLYDADGNPTAEAGFYLSANRNKRSITIDHSTPEGADLVRALAEPLRRTHRELPAGVLEKYGLDYETLHELNPGLVYCSITGFGQDGPYADRPGYDGVFQAMSGMMSVSGIPDGEPGAGPMKVGISMIDILTGLYAGNAILAALRHREVGGGSGQHIDLSLLDCGVASLSHYAQNYLVSGVAAPRRGNGGFGGIPSQTFCCADGAEIFLVASTPRQWASVAKVIGRPELAYDERFATVSARIANRDLVLRTLDEAFRTRTGERLALRARVRRRPRQPGQRPATASSPTRKCVTAACARRSTTRSRARWTCCATRSACPRHRSRTYRTPPTLGQHTHEILSEVLGMDAGGDRAARAERASSSRSGEHLDQGGLGVADHVLLDVVEVLAPERLGGGRVAGLQQLDQLLVGRKASWSACFSCASPCDRHEVLVVRVHDVQEHRGQHATASRCRRGRRSPGARRCRAWRTRRRRRAGRLRAPRARPAWRSSWPARRPARPQPTPRWPCGRDRRRPGARLGTAAAGRCSGPPRRRPAPSPSRRRVPRGAP